MNRSLVTGLVIGAAVVTAGATVANFARSDRTTQAGTEAPAPPVVVPENVAPENVEVVVDNTPKFAEVLNVDTVTKTTRKPRQVCNDRVVTHTAPPKDENRIAGTVIGAVVGGVLGNQIGDGRGKKLATAAGAAAGGYTGNKVQEQMQNGNTYTTTETNCSTVYDSSEKIIGYDVRYRLGDQEGTVRMDRAPGERLPVDENGELQIAGRSAQAR
jgi:uncharacterized protein YcfJ